MYPANVLLHVLGQLLVFLSDLAVLLFSTVLMQMCILLYYWADKMMMMIMMMMMMMMMKFTHLLSSENTAD